MPSPQKIIEEFHRIKCTKRRLALAELYIDLQRNKPKQPPKILLYPDYPKDVEIFENVIGYEGVYQIGNWGTLKAIEGFFIKNKKGGKEKMAVYKPETIRMQYYDGVRYPKVNLWLGGKSFSWITHRIVAKHFIPNPNNYPQVCHIDDNHGNPKWDNLFWGTQSHNIMDAVKKGRGFRGRMNGNSKLKEEDIPAIRWLLWMGITTKNTGVIFNVSNSTIKQIRSGKTWDYLK